MPFISKAAELRRENTAFHARRCAMLDEAGEGLDSEKATEWDPIHPEYKGRQADIQKEETAGKHEAEILQLDRRRAGRETATALLTAICGSVLAHEY